MLMVRLGALLLLCSPLSVPAFADTGSERTDVVLRGLPSLTDGAGVVAVRTRLAGDVALCTGRLRLRVVDLAADRVVVDRSRQVAQVRRFRVRLDAGRHRVVGTYETGDRDPCAVSRDVRRVRVRD